MYDCTVNLIPKINTVNAAGDTIETDGTPYALFCRIVTADEKEKTFAESRGKSAELVVIIPDRRYYGGEIWLDYDGDRYEVVDTKYGDTNREVRLVVRKWLNR